MVSPVVDGYRWRGMELRHCCATPEAFVYSLYRFDVDPPRPGDRELPMGQPPKQERVASQSLKRRAGCARSRLFGGEIAPRRAALSEVNISERLGISRNPGARRPGAARTGGHSRRDSLGRLFGARLYRRRRGRRDSSCAACWKARRRGWPPSAGVAAETGLAQLRAIRGRARPDRCRARSRNSDFIAYEDLNARFHQMLAGTVAAAASSSARSNTPLQLPLCRPKRLSQRPDRHPSVSGIAGDRPGPSPRAGPRHRDAGGFACRVARARACAAGAPEPRFRHEGQLAHRARSGPQARLHLSRPPAPKTHAVERPGGCQPSRALCQSSGENCASTIKKGSRV